MVVAPMALVGTASAAPAVGSTFAVQNPAYVTPGNTSSSSPTFVVTLGTGSTYSAGDVIRIDIPQALATNAGALSFVGTPAVATTAPAGSTAPQFSAALTHDAANTASTGTDEITLTETGPSITAATTGPETVSVTGLKIAAGSLAPTGTSNATATYTTAPTSVAGVSSAIGAPAAVATVGNETTAVASAPSQLTSAAATALPNITIAEAGTPTATPRTITLTISNGTFSGTPTVTSSNSAVTVTPAAPAGATFSFVATGAGAATFTVSGIQATPTGTINTASDQIVGTVNDNAVAGQPVLLGAFAAANSPIAGPDADTTAATSYNNAAAAGVATNSLVLATDYAFPDALSASYLAGDKGIGIALTMPNSLPAATQQIILAHQPTTIYVLGGPVAISPAVVSQVKALYPAATPPAIVTLAGADAYGTNQQVVDAVPATDIGKATLPFGTTNPYNDNTTGASSTTGPTGGGPFKTAIVATGTNYSDALAAGPLAYKEKFPVILTDGTSLSPTAQALLGGLGIQQVILLGGPAAISDTVEGQIAGATGLNIPTLRVAGTTGRDTAQLLAQFEHTVFAAGFPANVTTFVARGDQYTDALTAAPYLSTQSSPILLTHDSATVGGPLTSYLNAQGKAHNDTIQQFGGIVAITPATSTAMQQAVVQGHTAP